jgi:hypothetical protein
MHGAPGRGAGDDHALHVLRERRHRLADVFAGASSPPIAKTGIGSGTVARLSFCTRVASKAR